MMTTHEARIISRSRANYLMGAIGKMGGILLVDVHDEMICVQPAGSGIADGHVVPVDQILLGMRTAEQIGTDELDAIQSAKSLLVL